MQVALRMEQRRYARCSIARADSSVLVGGDEAKGHKVGFNNQVLMEIQHLQFFDVFDIFPEEVSYSDMGANDRAEAALSMAAASYLPVKPKPSPAWYEQNIDLIAPAIQARNAAVEKLM